MFAELPIVFLAFANSLDDHLATLKDESRDIFRRLQPLQKDNKIFIHREESSEFDELYQDLLAYDDRIVIFHYGGHADGATLTLEGGGGGAGGIAGLLGQQSSLKLVFLNGCATKDQVKLLHAAGVPAVIATSVKINDSRATQFSTAFYAALAQGNSIFEAFDSASNYIEGKFGSDGSSGIVINRFPNFDHEEEDTTPEVFEWALYSKKHAARDLEQWRLPEARENWQIQLEDTRGPLRDLDGNPQLIEHRLRSRTVDAIRCTSCGSASSILNNEAASCPVCGSNEVEAETAKTKIAYQALPFLISESDAHERVLECLGAESSKTIRLAQVFLPYWAFTVNTRTTVEAERGVSSAHAEVAPKLEWESVKDTIELAFDSYLVPAATVPSSGDVAAGDWYWELDKAESLTSLPDDKACIPLDVPMELAFQQFTAHFDRELEAELVELVGGLQQRNITTDTRYRKVSAQSFLLPHWYATVNLEEGQTGLLVNGQTGAVRSLPLPGTIQLHNGSQANMAKRTYEPAGRPAQPSIAASVFASVGIGLMVGAMLGLSASATVGVFIGAIGTALAALLGLNDRHFSTAKAIRIGTFGFAALIAAPAGIYVRDHQLLVPEHMRLISLAETKERYEKLGFDEPQVNDLLSQHIVGVIKSSEKQVADASRTPAPGALQASKTKLETCNELKNPEFDQFEPDKLNDAFFEWTSNDDDSKKWKPLFDDIEGFEAEDQKLILYIARDASCGYGDFDKKPLLPSKTQCESHAVPNKPFTGMDEQWQKVEQGASMISQNADKALVAIGKFLCR